MRSRNNDRAIDEVAEGRRQFLRLVATVPFAVQTSLWLSACSGEKQEGSSAGPKGIEPGEMSEKTATGKAEAGSTASEAGSGVEPPAASTEQAAASEGAEATEDGRLVTEIAAMQPTVEALKYTNQSTTEGQHCEICQFYTAKGGGRGKCQLFAQGLVNAQGWCTSWTKRVQAG